MNLFEFFKENHNEMLQLTFEHLLLVVIATGAATVVGVPVGILLTRKPLLSKPVLAFANILQTIPSLALFGFLIPILGAYGIGRLPAIIALFLYSLLPIIRNTFTGINGVDPAVREAARGMGMTDWQMLVQVELPLALNVILAGLRVATVISIGTATIAAAIGAGGLGMYIFRGLRMNDNTLVLAGAVPAALMALAADFLLGWFEKLFAVGSLRNRGEAQKSQLKWAFFATGAMALLVAVMLFLNQGLFAKREGINGGAPPEGKVVIASKDFTEQLILSEIVAQLLESRAAVEVERKFELAGDLSHRGMLAGEVDGYVEYTGTAFMAILKHQRLTDPRAVYEQTKREYAERFHIEWFAPLGFQNTFAVLVRGAEARRLNLQTISQAARYAPEWRAGFGQDFMSRQDGYPGFAKTYGLKFAAPPREMDLSLTYRALAAQQVDLIAGNSTDGLIDKLDLFQLEDDKKYFPPYEAAVVFRQATLQRYPKIVDALKRLEGKLNDAEMRRLNYAVDAEHRSPKEVAREFLAKQDF
ncbi:MAG: ABC transporter permease subunit [Acidobacteria bacterium]|nr:ABC transporter permease subunit [Acidobacteriota bacterium]